MIYSREQHQKISAGPYNPAHEMIRHLIKLNDDLIADLGPSARFSLTVSNGEINWAMAADTNSTVTSGAGKHIIDEWKARHAK